MMMGKASPLSVGWGEISGSVSLDKKEELYELDISDGWNNIPSVVFNFCPYCGRNLMSYKKG